MKPTLLTIARQLLSFPTAPFREHLVSGYIRRFCTKRHFTIKEDAAGNLIVQGERRPPARAFAFVAHMDHPGFIIEKIYRNGYVSALFYGGWDPREFQPAPVTIFTDDGPVQGRAVRWSRAPGERARRAKLEIGGPVAVGDLGMWSFDPCRIDKGILHSRSCDDLIGCALILTVLDRYSAATLPFYAVFTVAEEAGLHGAKYLCSRKLLPRTSIPISVETSRELPTAPIGGGGIIRVGDSRTVFNPEVLLFMESVARELREMDKSFQFQRKLMDGGQCEASVFNLFGYKTAGISVPLGNYHNRNFQKKTTEAEYVSLKDLLNTAKLMYALSSRQFTSEKEAPAYKESFGTLGQMFLISE